MTVDHAPPLVVVDTDVVSIIHNKDRDERAPYYETALAGRRLLVSFQTLEEIRYGMLDRGWGVKRRNEMERHLDQYEIAWPDRRTATASARLRAKCKAAGRELKQGTPGSPRPLCPWTVRWLRTTTISGKFPASNPASS